jgi:hypothetical protein
MCLPSRYLAATVYSCCLATDVVPLSVSGPLLINECCFRAVRYHRLFLWLHSSCFEQKWPVYIINLIKICFNVSVFRYGEKQRRNDGTELTGIQLLSATAYHLKKPNQQLLIPITVWIGMEQAFIGADFTQVRTATCRVDLSACSFIHVRFHIKRPHHWACQHFSFCERLD